MAKLQTISVKESATELVKLIGNSSPAIKPRLKMLLAIANGITSTNELTTKTKSNRESIRQWKNIYFQDGINGLLEDNRGDMEQLMKNKKWSYIKNCLTPRVGLRLTNRLLHGLIKHLK